MDGSTEKLEAVIEYAQPNEATEIAKLAENVGDFDFFEGVRSCAQYGKRLVCMEFGVSELELENCMVLKQYIDFEGYGKAKMAGEDCAFMSTGFVECHGNLDEILGREPEQSQGMNMD